MPSQERQTNVRNNIDVKDPDLFDVLMLNDDFTTMDFVVKVLQAVFYKIGTDAERMMLEIHRKGSCVVGTYTLDIAQSKMNKAMRMAREEGFPLRLRMKPHKRK